MRRTTGNQGSGRSFYEWLAASSQPPWRSTATLTTSSESSLSMLEGEVVPACPLKDIRRLLVVGIPVILEDLLSEHVSIQHLDCPWFTLDLFEAPVSVSFCGDLPWENYTDVYKSSINFNALLSEHCLGLSMTACSSLCVIHIGSVRGQWYYWLRQMLNNSYSHLYSSRQEPRKH